MVSQGWGQQSDRVLMHSLFPGWWPSPLCAKPHAASDTFPCRPRAAFTLIFTSCPGAVRNSIGRSTSSMAHPHATTRNFTPSRSCKHAMMLNSFAAVGFPFGPNIWCSVLT